MGIIGLRRLWVSVGLLFLALLHPAGTLLGQDESSTSSPGTLHTGRVEVDLGTPGGSINVRAVYSLLPEPGTGLVPISVLTPALTRLESLRVLSGVTDLVRSAGRGPGYSLDAIRDHFFEGEVRLPPEAINGPFSEGPALDGPSPLTLEFQYLVEDAWADDESATVPLLVPRWTPYQPEPETFLARVDVPAGFTITGSFPTSVLRRPAPGTPGSYEVGLQAPPSLLILRVAQGEGSFLTLERSLDLLVVLILIVMGAAGLRYLRGRER